MKLFTTFNPFRTKNLEHANRLFRIIQAEGHDVKISAVDADFGNYYLIWVVQP